MKFSTVSKAESPLGRDGKLPANSLSKALVGAIEIGTPPQTLSILFDTGSSLFWVRSAKCTTSACAGKPSFASERSSTYVPTPLELAKQATVTYGDGTVVRCIVNNDVITIAGRRISNQNLCEANSIITTTEESDGIIGLAPPSLAGNASTSVAEVFPGLVTASASNVGFWYNRYGVLKGNGDAGEITFGTIDGGKYSGSIQWVSITNDRKYWNILLSSVMLADGRESLDAPITMAVDTGTTLTRIPKEVFERLNTIFKANSLGSDIYAIDCKTVKSIPPITFKFGTVSLTLTWEQLVILDNDSKRCISIFQPVNDSRSFILGATFLSNFYTLFDYSGLRVGFAKSAGQATPVVPNSALGRVNLMLVLIFLIVN